MHIRSLIIAALLLTIAPTAPADTDGWIPLFNGKNLDGWTPKITGYDLGDNFGDTFRVTNGVIQVNYDKYDNFAGKFGHLFYKTSFSNYVIRAEYRFTGTQCPGGPGWALRNSGIMIHGQPPETIAKNQNFPVSIEVQLLGGDGQHERTTGNLCTPGTNVVIGDELITRHCTNAKSKTFPGDQWVTIEVEVHGNGAIKHFINGDLVLEYRQAQLDPNDGDAKKLLATQDKMLHGGSISLQAESHPVEFRKVEIKLLPD